jgi:hypothetical protein
MIQSFKNQQTEDVFNGNRNKKAAKVLPLDLWDMAARRLTQNQPSHRVAPSGDSSRQPSRSLAG